GVAKFLSPQPGMMVVNPAFFQLVLPQTKAVVETNVPNSNDKVYLAKFNVIIGQTTEKGLIIDIDWGDETPDGVSQRFEGHGFSKVTQDGNAVDGLVGGTNYHHTYTLSDILFSRTRRDSEADPFNVLFSVSQHPGIVVFGASANGEARPNAFDNGVTLLSSTDFVDLATQSRFAAPIEGNRLDTGVAIFLVPRVVPPDTPNFAGIELPKPVVVPPIAAALAAPIQAVVTERIFTLPPPFAIPDRKETFVREFKPDNKNEDAGPSKEYQIDLFFDESQGGWENTLLSDPEGQRQLGTYELYRVLGQSRTLLLT
ncbi:MAG: hypothetical protein NT069_18825, partial [Planctomycetota bacterium]|nr:hypothetical protein [Planctomycetota bacterium]